jgi:hypothetical protein
MKGLFIGATMLLLKNWITFLGVNLISSQNFRVLCKAQLFLLNLKADKPFVAIFLLWMIKPYSISLSRQILTY